MPSKSLPGGFCRAGNGTTEDSRNVGCTLYGTPGCCSPVDTPG
ncbi:MAG TPA: hypothetical protein V6C65_38645 [Allocoleopsis sp.]